MEPKKRSPPSHSFHSSVSNSENENNFDRTKTVTSEKQDDQSAPKTPERVNTQASRSPFKEGKEDQIKSLNKFGSQSRFNHLASVSKSCLLPQSLSVDQIRDEIDELTSKMEESISNGQYRKAEEINDSRRWKEYCYSKKYLIFWSWEKKTRN